VGSGIKKFVIPESRDAVLYIRITNILVVIYSIPVAALLPTVSSPIPHTTNRLVTVDNVTDRLQTTNR